MRTRHVLEWVHMVHVEAVAQFIDPRRDLPMSEAPTRATRRIDTPYQTERVPCVCHGQ